MASMVWGRSMRLMFICVLFVLHMSIYFSCCLCITSDTILAGQSLLPNQTIISREGKFELGFFAPGNSSNYSVGIWYRNIPVQTVVWVANRNSPIPYSFYNSSRVELSNDSLYLYVNLERIIIVGTSNATGAVILDTGNFVLRNALGIIWQSFDNPTDTLLPGGKVGVDRGFDAKAKLVSWRNQNDPAIGDFSLVSWGELVIMRNNSQAVWNSGGTFSWLSGLSNISNWYNISFISRDDFDYLVYNVFDESMISRIVMDYVGQMIHFVWSEASQAWIALWKEPSYNICEIYASCGLNAICDINTSPPCSCLTGFVPRATQDWQRYNFSGGCVRQYPKNCLPKNDFTKVSNVILVTNSKSVEVERFVICKLACTTNCSCDAYAFNDKGICSLFFGYLLDLKRSPNNFAGMDLYVRMDNGRSVTGNRNVLRVALPMLITGVILVCSILVYFSRKLKNRVARRAYQNLLLLDLNANETANIKRISVQNNSGDKNNNYELPIFSFSSIVAVTNNFSITNKLGEGGFGPVYKGELLNKQFVAVKRLSRRSGQGLEEFRTETQLIAKLQHRNLLGILGCCIENNEKILVYEYMSNKSLDFFLFEPAKKELLDWRRRVHIIEGIARGLRYLHHYSRLRIVHRDLKASNILLDVEMNPKISDFGMARIFGGNDSQANTNRIVGTYGYMSPEYAMKGLFSLKSDVFAFGVLMLEIITGKKNTGFYGSEYLSLLEYTWNMWKQNKILELIDPALEVPSSSSSIPLRYIQIGLLCVQENPANRPIMSDVVAMLNNEQTTLPSPNDPAFTFGRTLVKAIPEQRNAEICSVNGLTVSMMEAR